MSGNTKQIGEHCRVRCDGNTLTIEQPEVEHTVSFESYEVIELLQFINDQAGLRAMIWDRLRAQARDVVNPKWQYSALHRCWRYMVGTAHIELAERPVYCDRGRWIATETGVGDIDACDEFPRYFMDLTRAKLEMQEWLDFRMREYTDNEYNRVNKVHNRIRDLRDAVRRMLAHTNETESQVLTAAYAIIEHRLAPEGLDR